MKILFLLPLLCSCAATQVQVRAVHYDAYVEVECARTCILQKDDKLIAAIDKAWWAPQWLITQALVSKSFTSIEWIDEGRVAVRLHDVNVGTANAWMMGEYAGDKREFTIPFRVKKLYVKRKL